MMSTSGTTRPFAILVVSAALIGAALLMPLALTLFPSELLRTLYGYDVIASMCAASLHAFTSTLPPLGVAILALSAAAIGAATVTGIRLVRQTHRACGLAAHVPLPEGLRNSATALGLDDAVLCIEDDEPLAYCVGFLRPTICISTGAIRRLRRRELDAVLLHEATHLRNRDPLRILAARVLSTAFITVPAIAVLARRFEVAKELEADREAVRRQGTPRHLAGALYVMARQPPATNLVVSAWSISHARIDALAGGRPHLPAITLRTHVMTVVALAAALALSTGQAARAHIIEVRVEPHATVSHSCPVPAYGVLL